MPLLGTRGAASAKGFGFLLNTGIAPGTFMDGGYFGGQFLDGGIIYNLIVSPKASGFNASLQYKTSDTTDGGVTASLTNGPANSAAINNSAHPAAQFCEGLTINGFSDWYLGSYYEMNQIYRTLKPVTGSSFTFTGANPNAIPGPKPNYTSTDPLQTTAVDFQDGGSEAFVTNYAWTSTVIYEPTWATGVNFAQGGQFGDTLEKSSFYQVRAIRRVVAT